MATILFCFVYFHHTLKMNFFRTFAPDFHSIFIFINSPSLPFSAAVEAFCSLSHFNVIWQQPQTKSILRAFHYALLRTLKCDKLWFFLCNFAHNFNLLFFVFLLNVMKKKLREQLRHNEDYIKWIRREGKSLKSRSSFL